MTDAIETPLPAGKQPEMTATEREIAELKDALGQARGTVYDLEERLHGIDQVLDEPGWHPMFAHSTTDGGLTLRQTRFAALQLRELLAGNPLLKRGSQARLTYVWGGGVQFGAVLASGRPSKLTTDVLNRMAAPTSTWRRLFSNAAHEELERAAFTDGNIFLLGDRTAKTMQRVSMDQITADMRDPDDLETIWMFRREWDRNPYGTAGEDRQHTVLWYYTDAYEGPRRSQVQSGVNGKLEPVDLGKTMIHLKFNSQSGWGYGVGDALPVIAWLRLYREFLTNGYVMSKALAQIAFKVTSQTAAGASRAAAEIAMPGQQAGGTASLGVGNDLSAVTSAGKGYEFDSGKPLAAAIAAGLEISVDTLLAGEINDSLDITARLMATMRRLNWDDHYARILAFLGSTRTLRTTWNDLPVEQIQRQMQAWTLANNSATFEGEIIQAGMARVLNISDPGPVPSYYKDTLTGGDTQRTSTTGATATDGTGQGQGDGNPTGNSDTRGKGAQDPAGGTSTD